MGRDFSRDRRCLILVSPFLFLSMFSPRAAFAWQPPGAADSSAQIMTRGPVHEAFAAPLVHDPKPGPVIDRMPPKPVEELPPDQKPVGANVQWIPGYWQWDAGRNDFLWISGVWRDPPPGCQWVPGYWNEVQGGTQWVPGAWVPIPEAAQSQAAPSPSQSLYLPAPPPSLEIGPSSPAPAAEVFWSPGCWTWQGARYVWRPGFWAAVQPGWVWMPAHFVWTPSGYLFVQGYWDLPIATRGILFAPVYYPSPVYLQPGYVFTPSISIVSSSFTANLFVQPAYSHYCFGDYYAQSFLSVGIVPWFSLTVATGPSYPRFYDPLFSYYSVVNVRRDPQWVTHVREEYIVRRDNVARRPPQTFVEQTRILRAEGPRGGVRERVTVMARPVGEMPQHQREEAHALRLERVNAASRQQWQHRAAELSTFRQERINQEREGARSFATAGGQGGRPIQPRPMNLSGSPIAARSEMAHGGFAQQRLGEGGRRPEMSGVPGHNPTLSHGGEGNAKRSPGIRNQGKPSEMSRAAGHNPPVPRPGLANADRLPGGEVHNNMRQPDLIGRSSREFRTGSVNAAAPSPHLQPMPDPSHVPIQPRPNPSHSPMPRNLNPGGGERRVPAHPTPYQHQRRERGKG